MQNKSTSDLCQELMNQPDLDQYLRENRTLFSNQDVSGLLSRLYEQKTLTKAALARQANISEVYLHQVFSSRRTPSRDRLLCICIGLGASLDETQELLKQAGYAPLYPKLKRDAIISHGLLRHLTLNAINDKLFLENERALF